jgi:surface antigen
MRSRGISRLAGGVFCVASLILSAEPSSAANCALYVRAETGVALYGAAGRWWDEAEGRYARGHMPVPGAIIVFKRTGHMPSGHVAIVTKAVSANEILVDHANWHHGTISRGISVIDTSPNHDWTEVAVMDQRSGKHGRDNPTFGFIYPRTGPQGIVETIDQSLPDPHVGDRDAWAGLVHLAVATEDLDGGAMGMTPRRSRKVRSAHRGHWASTAHASRGQSYPAAD